MNLPGIEGQLMAAREYWSDKREAELTRLRERVAELERDLRDTTWQDHADAWQKRALAAEAKFAAAERDAARLEFVLPVICGGDTTEADSRAMAICAALMRGIDGRAAIDAAMALRSGGEGDRNG